MWFSMMWPCGPSRPEVKSVMLPAFVWPISYEWLKNYYLNLKWLKIFLFKRIIFCGPWKLYEIQISVSRNKVYWNIVCVFDYLLSMTAFTLQWQGWVSSWNRLYIPQNLKYIVLNLLQDELLSCGLCLWASLLLTLMFSAIIFHSRCSLHLQVFL